MSSQSMRSEQARFETCRNCKHWNHIIDGLGRCSKFTQRLVMTFDHHTCENFKAKKEVKA